MDTFKYYYFKVNARGGMARAILSYAKANWEDAIVDHATWAQMKQSDLPEFKQLPVLVHGDKKLAQSRAIEIYLAKLFKIYGDNVEQEYQIDSLLCSFEDVFIPFHDVFWPNTEELKNNLEKNKAITIEKFKTLLKVCENRYVNNGKGKYFLGEKFTLADIYVAFALTYFDDCLKEKLLETNAPNVNELIKRIKENELKEFFEKYYNKGL